MLRDAEGLVRTHTKKNWAKTMPGPFPFAMAKEHQIIYIHIHVSLYSTPNASLHHIFSQLNLGGVVGSPHPSNQVLKHFLYLNRYLSQETIFS